MTAVWLLPVVTLIVASSTGGTIAAPLASYSTSHALLTLTVSAVLVFIGLGLALMILTMYLLRLIIHGVPPNANVLSVFIPLGPMGQGGYSILLLGQGFQSLLPLRSGGSAILRQEHAGEIISVLSVCAAMVLWSLATMWFVYAVLAVVEVTRQTRVPFKQAFWGLIFPNVSPSPSPFPTYRIPHTPHTPAFLSSFPPSFFRPRSRCCGSSRNPTPHT